MQPSKQSEITHEVIESVVHLTEQRDELTLLRSLQESILEMLPGVEMSMICVVPGPQRGQWVRDEAIPLPKPMFPITARLLAEVASLSAELPTRQLDEDGHSYFISSLGLQDERRKAIAIRLSKWDTADLRIAQGMLKIYANYAKMLFDSERDTLTGLYNRKKLEQKLGELLTGRLNGRKRKNDQTTDDYLAVFDLDHFKRINDNFGHLIGDEVLLVFAGLMRNALRDVDWVFRYGGEEFVVLIKDVSSETIAAILERIRAKVNCRPTCSRRRTRRFITPRSMAAIRSAITVNWCAAASLPRKSTSAARSNSSEAASFRLAGTAGFHSELRLDFPI